MAIVIMAEPVVSYNVLNIQLESSNELLKKENELLKKKIKLYTQSNKNIISDTTIGWVIASEGVPPRRSKTPTRKRTATPKRY